MPLTIEEAITRVPQWAGIKEITITPLGGGITNQNFRVDIGKEAFIIRIPAADPDLLGSDLESEYAANLRAGQLGIAPEVVNFIRPEGYLVTRLIQGHPLPPDKITLPNNIRRVVETLKKVHAMDKIPGRFDVFRAVYDYSVTALRYQVTFPRNYDWLIARTLEAEKALREKLPKLRPCHNDLINANILTNGRIYILGWEYSGMGDIFFDLANFSDHHKLSDEQDHWLLKCYFDRDPTQAQLAHFTIMKIMSDLCEAAWGLVQSGISKLDFDFRAYAEEYFGRVGEKIIYPHWNEWLKEVSNYG